MYNEGMNQQKPVSSRQLSILIVTALVSFGLGGLSARYLPSSKISPEREQPVPTTPAQVQQIRDNWQTFTHEYISFQHPADWKVRETITNYLGTTIYFDAPNRYSVFELALINNPEGLEPKKYYHAGPDEELFEILRSEEPFQGYPAVSILGNINAIQGWPGDDLIIQVPERSVLVRLSYSADGLKGGAAEQLIHEEFNPIVKSLVIKKK
jgi:hypothetical protein